MRTKKRKKRSTNVITVIEPLAQHMGVVYTNDPVKRRMTLVTGVEGKDTIHRIVMHLVM
jgi:hypothetical protein